MFSLRLAAADGAPDAHLETDPDPRARGGGRGAALPEGRHAPARPASSGPVQAFDARREERRSAPRSRRTRATSCSRSPTTRPSTARASSRGAPPRRRRRSARCSSPASSPRTATSARSGSTKAEDARRRRAASTRRRADRRAPRARRATRAAAPTGATRSRTTTRSSRSIPTTSRRCSRASSSTPRRASARRRSRSSSARSRGARAASRSLRAMVGRAPRAGSHDRGRRDAASATPRSASTTPRSLARPHRARRRAARRGRRRRAGSSASSRRTPTARRALAAAAQALRRRSATGRARSRCYRRALDLAPEDTDDDARARRRLRARRTDRRAAHAPASASSSSSRRRRTCASTSRTPSRAKPRADEAYARPSPEFLEAARQPARRAEPPHARRPPGHHGVPERPREPLPPDRLPAAHRRGRRRGARVRASASRPTRETVQLRGAHVYREERPGRRGHRERRGRRPTTRRSRCTRARAPSTCTSRGSTRATSSSCTTASRTSPQRNAFADYFGEVVYMQSTEPIARTEYVLITPKSRHVLLQQAERRRASRRRSRRRATRRSTTSSPRTSPPLEPEPLQPPLAEIARPRPRLDLQELGRHGPLVLGPRQGPVHRRRRGAPARRRDHQGPHRRQARKVRAIYDYVVQKTRYVALEFGIHGFKPYRCAQIFARGFGDCKDKATLIVTMLKELGIPATIVIVRTGHARRLRDRAGEPRAVRSRDRLRAVARPLPRRHRRVHRLDRAPAMDRGALALQVNEGKPKLVHLPEPPASRERRRASTSRRRVGADGTAQIDWRVDVTGVERAARGAQRYHAEGAPQAARPGGSRARAARRSRSQTVDGERSRGRRADGAAPREGQGARASRARDGDTLERPVGAARAHGPRLRAALVAPARHRASPRRPRRRRTSTTIKLPPGAKVIGGAAPARAAQSPFGIVQGRRSTRPAAASA